MTFQLFTYIFSSVIFFICISDFLCAQFVINCLQSYNELHVCGNLMCNTHSLGNKYLAANVYMYI